MDKIKPTLIAALCFGLCLGIPTALLFNINITLITGSVSGILFGLIIHMFVNSKKVAQQTQITTTSEGTIILSASANHFVNKEGVGGKLYLLHTRLKFQSHQYNIQNHSFEVAISTVQTVQFFNAMGLIPTGIQIELSNGSKERFVVSNRKI